MKNILVTSAILTCDGQTYIYSPDGRPAGIKTGEPYCSNLDVEVLAPLDAACLYPVEEPLKIVVRRPESIVQP